jgi:transcriptional regulator with XRE-family HTH domain
MTIGQRLRRAMARAGLTQKEVAFRTGLQTATVSDIVNDRSQPAFDTVERMVAAIGTTYGELFDEPQIHLSYEDAAVARSFADVLRRLLENDALQAAIRKTNTSIRPPRRRSKPSSETSAPTPPSAPKGTVIRDGPRRIRNENHEVGNLPNEPIPEPYYRNGARRAFKVLTDAMIGSGILLGSIIYTSKTIDLNSADGEIIVCTLNGTLYLKRLDLRSGQKVLESTNPRYPALFVDESDELELIGVMVTPSES